MTTLPLKRSSRTSSRNGFTIVEVMIGAAIGVVILLVASQAYNTAQKRSHDVQSLLEDKIDLAISERQLVYDLGRAAPSFNNLSVQYIPNLDDSQKDFFVSNPDWPCPTDDATCVRTKTLANVGDNIVFILDVPRFGPPQSTKVERAYDIGVSTNPLVSPSLSFKASLLSAVLEGTPSSPALFNNGLLTDGQLILIHSSARVAPAGASNLARYPVTLVQVAGNGAAAAYNVVNPLKLVNSAHPLNPGYTPATLDEYFRTLPAVPGSESIYIRPVQLIRYKLEVAANGKKDSKGNSYMQLTRYPLDVTGKEGTGSIVRTGIYKAIFRRPSVTVPSVGVDYQ